MVMVVVMVVEMKKHGGPQKASTCAAKAFLALAPCS
jgi:hypothetical protein